MSNDMKKTEKPQLTSTQILQKYPEAHQYFVLQSECLESKYEERLKFWKEKNIRCFDRWTVPYFLEREKNKQKPCLRLNYRPNGQCKDCTAGSCVYDNICFICGQDGHGGFHTHPGGKYQGQLKCIRHRNIVDQLEHLKEESKLEEEALQIIVNRDPHPNTKKSNSQSIHKNISLQIRHHVPPQNLSTKSAPPVVRIEEPDNISIGDNSTSSEYTVASSTKTSRPNSSNSLKLDEKPVSQQRSSPVVGSITIQGNVWNNSKATNLGNTEGKSPSNDYDNVSSISTPPSTRHSIDTMSATTISATVAPVTAPKVIDPPIDYELTDDDRYDYDSSVMRLYASQSHVIYTSASGMTIFRGELCRKKLDMNTLLQHGKNMNSTSTSTSIVTSKPIAIKTIHIHNNILQHHPHILNNIKNELKTLKKLSSKCPYIIQPLYASYYGMNFPLGSPTTWCAMLFELCHSNLHDYIRNYSLQHATSSLSLDINSTLIAPMLTNGHITSDHFKSSTLQQHHQHKVGLSQINKQILITQLLDAYLFLHQNNLCHQTVHPQDILLTVGNPLVHLNLFDQNYLIKLNDFRIGKTLISSNGQDISDGMVVFGSTVYTAPEVLRVQTYEAYQSVSDIWSLGCILYFIATNGQNLFNDEKEVLLSETNEEFRQSKLQSHYLHDTNPILYDLIERMVRPLTTAITTPKSNTNRPIRIGIREARCHPYLWNLTTKKQMIFYFFESINKRSDTLAVRSFRESFEVYSSTFIFASKSWPDLIYKEYYPYLGLEQIKDSGKWSGILLLQVIYNMINYPINLKNNLYPNITINEVKRVVLTRILDIDFPKLVVLLFELGSWFGKWSWDDNEVQHTWNLNV